MNMPGYNFIPAPLWMISTLHIVTLTLHLAAMNFLAGGLIVLMHARMDDKWNQPVVRRFVALFPTAMAATVTLGVAPLLFLQLAYHRQAYAASIVSGWWWLLIVGAVMIAYYCLYAATFTRSRFGVPVLLWAAMVLLVYVSLVYSTVFSMAERPDLYHALYASDRSGLAVNPDVDSWNWRWLHMVAGAVTGGAFFIGLLGRSDETVYRMSRGFFLGGMAASMVMGITYLVNLEDAFQPLMRSPAMWLIALSLALSLGSLHFYFRRRMLTAGLMLFVSVTSMVVVRHVLRLIVLQGKWEPSAIPVKPQWSVFALFVVCFVAAIGVVAFMLRVFFGDRARAMPEERGTQTAG